MILRSGHAIGDTFYLFWHKCPGALCSVERWIQWKEEKRKYEAARLGLKYFGSGTEKSSEGVVNVLLSEEFQSDPDAACYSDRILTTRPTRTVEHG